MWTLIGTNLSRGEKELRPTCNNPKRNCPYITIMKCAKGTPVSMRPSRNSGVGHLSIALPVDDYLVNTFLALLQPSNLAFRGVTTVHGS
jgi:hypothetical protein